MKKFFTPIYFFFFFSLLSLNAEAQLAGSYTINSAVATGGTNFQSFSDLADTLNSTGVSGPVTLNVVSGSGPYNERILLDSVIGTSSTNTIEIRGNNEEIIFGLPADGDEIFAIKNSSFIRIHSLSFRADTIIKHLTFSALAISGSCNNILVDSCSFIGQDSTEDHEFFGRGIVLQSKGDTISSVSVNQIGIYHNSFNRFKFAVYAPFDHNNLNVSNVAIHNNEISLSDRGIHIKKIHDSLSIRHNSIKKVLIAAIIYDGEFVEISDNEFLLQKDSSDLPILYGYTFGISCIAQKIRINRNLVVANFAPVSVSVGDSAEILNNCVTGIGGEAGTAYSPLALHLHLDSCDYALVANNTIIQSHGAGYGALKIDGIGSRSLCLLNNSITANHDYWGIWIYPDSIISCMDNNNYFNRSSTGIIGVVGDSLCNSLADVKSVALGFPHDSNSISENPLFISNTDLYPLDTVLAGIGTIRAGVTEDVKGNPRPAVFRDSVDCGCYEFDTSGFASKIRELANLGFEFIQVFPNPAYSYIEVNLNDGYDYTIIDLQGRIVSEGFLEGSRIELEGLSQGMYIVKFFNDKEQFMSSLVKL